MKGAGKGVTSDGAIRDGAREEITRGTHLMALYPALVLTDSINDHVQKPLFHSTRPKA